MNTLDQAITVSEKILHAVQQTELETVTALEVERQTLIQQYFSTTQDVDVEKTEQLKQLNDDILHQLNQVRSKLREQQSSLIKGSKASKAYLSNL